MDLAKERSALIYKIIEEIRSFPAIWDVTWKGYKDNYARNEAYNAVANEMNMTGEYGAGIINDKQITHSLNIHFFLSQLTYQFFQILNGILRFYWNLWW